MKKKDNNGVFTIDETGSKWHRETNVDILKTFCREGYAMAKKHGHFIVGTGGEKNYIGIPGRFLVEDQPWREKDRIYSLAASERRRRDVRQS